MTLQNNERGSTFMLVIIGFAVLFIFSMTAILISNANKKQTINEKDKIQAYYVAKTGAESFINYLEHIKVDKDQTKEQTIKKLLNELNGKESKSSEFKDNDKKLIGNFKIKIEKIEDQDYRITSVGEANNAKREIIATLSLKEENKSKDNTEASSNNYWDGTIRAYKTITFKDLYRFMSATDITSGNYPKNLILETPRERNKEELEEGIFFKESELKKLFLSENINEKNFTIDIHNVKMGLRNIYPKNKLYDGYEIYDVNRDKVVLTVRYSLKEDEKEIQHSEALNKTFSLIGKEREKISSIINDDEYYNQVKFLKELSRIRDKDININDVNKTNKKIYESFTAKKTLFKNDTFDTIDATKSVTNTPLVLDIEEFVQDSDSKMTIVTSKNKDIKIVTKSFNLLYNAKINVIGDGNKNFYILGDAQLDSEKSHIGVDIYKTNDSTANITFNLKPGTQFQTNNGSKLEKIKVYGPKAKFQLGDDSWFEGQAIINDSTIKDGTNIRPFVLRNNKKEEIIDESKYSEEITNEKSSFKIKWNNSAD